MRQITKRQARRLALVRSGLLKPELTAMPRAAAGGGRRAHAAAHRVLNRHGYLQLDSISVAGARSHGIVLLSRVRGLQPRVAEELLQPGAPLFEYWGHEASWLPMELYAHFEWRREDYRAHPWWGDVLGDNPALAKAILERVEAEGPLRSADLPSDNAGLGAWDWAGPTRKVLSALWSAGDLAVVRRTHFHRSYDLTERVIPADVRARRVEREEALQTLLLRSLAGHGWASTGTLAATYRLRNMRVEIQRALAALRRSDRIAPCEVVDADRRRAGWIRTEDLELLDRVDRLRPRRDRGVLLSPFDPLLWDRPRTAWMFGFEALLEVFKPKAKRCYGYYCLPVLAGERLIGRLDVKADRAGGCLRVLSCHYEGDPAPAADREAVRVALHRYADALELEPVGAL